MLIVDNVSKTYDTKIRNGLFKTTYNKIKAVDEISFTLEPGKITGLLGMEKNRKYGFILENLYFFK